MTSGLTRRRLIGSGVGIASAQERPRTGDEALAELLAGNKRFVEGRLRNERRGSVRREQIAEEQKPFAIVLGCSDSRVPPEVLFDQGLGDLFIVRVAGNTATDPVVVGSVEYAAEHLGSVLLMVLGHESCGAVAGAVEVVTEGAHEPGSIGDMIAPVIPAVKQVHRSAPDASTETLVARSVQANIRRAVDELESNEALLSHLIEEGKLKVVGAEYHLETGEVQLV
jgi:carbonic anhydrase